MTRPGIEPRSPGPMANTLTARPMSGIKYLKSLSVNEKNFRFLSVFCDWSEFWFGISGKNGRLIKETLTALHHTNNTF